MALIPFEIIFVNILYNAEVDLSVVIQVFQVSLFCISKILVFFQLSGTYIPILASCRMTVVSLWRHSRRTREKDGGRIIRLSTADKRDSDCTTVPIIAKLTTKHRPPRR